MIKILWIDDNLDNDLTEKRMALYMETEFDPHFARDASEAYYRLRDEDFNVVIFDLRLPTGPDDMWKEVGDKVSGKNGKKLLELVKNNYNNDFSRHVSTKFGVFSIEAPDENAELFSPPVNLSKNCFMKKTDVYYEEEFISFIHRIHAQ
jgi:CheY-like chemotaxis protein